MQTRVLEQFLKSLDREKIYFLKSDIRKIRKKGRKLFSQLRRRNCSALSYIYDTYISRVESQADFAKKYLSGGSFKLDKKAVYILDSSEKPYPKSRKEAREALKSALQYQAANVFLVEEDMAKALKNVSYLFEDRRRKARSWKPHLNPRERRKCQEESKSARFQACKPAKWLSLYLNSFAQSLDSHSSYMDSDDIEEFQMAMRLSLEGIGATLSPRLGYTVVENLVPGGPAFKSGKLKRKDKILAVGQKKNSFVNIFGESIEDVVSIIRGKRGTPVYLKILREAEGKRKVFVVKLIRDKVNLESEYAASIYYIDAGRPAGGREKGKQAKDKQAKDKQAEKDRRGKGKKSAHQPPAAKPLKVAVIKVPSFYGSGSYGKSISRDVKKLLREAKRKKAAAVVLDLSYNRGGSLEEAVSLSGLFFAKGHVVKQSERTQSGTPYLLFSDRDESVVYKGPLAVLVNRLSASASEIVSGTLQNYKRAVIVGGDHTFGKGSVQSVEHIHKLGALKTTVGLYFIPSGQSTQKSGVSSDVVFPSIYALDELGEKELDHALPSGRIAGFRSPPERIFPKNPAESWQPVSREMIKRLREASKKRVAKNSKFQKIIERLKKIKEQTLKKKSITVAEILDEKGGEDEEGKKDREESGDMYDPRKIRERYLARSDVREAAFVAADLARLSRGALVRSGSQAAGGAPAHPGSQAAGGGAARSAVK